MHALAASKICKRFGGIVALDGAEFALEAGEVHALIGSNGCGKSTLCKIIAGAVGADAGELFVNGERVSFANPAAAAARGVEMFYQELSLIPAMTVAENIFLGREPIRRDRLVDRGRMDASAARLLAGFGKALGAGVHPQATIGDLSADQRQIVEILKVLARPSRIVVFDEATAALDRDQVAVVFDRIRALKAEGRSTIFISHRMDEVFAIADRITVMRNGATVTTARAADTSRDQLVMAMVGAEQASAAQRARHRPAVDEVLTVADLSAGKLAHVSFALRRGEILGLGGLHGQGQSDLLRALYGVIPLRNGAIAIGGRRFQPKWPIAAMRRSMAYVSGDRAKNGVMAIRPIFENLVVSILARNRDHVVARGKLGALLQPVVERLKLKFSSLEAPVTELSGGNQQKVVLARLLATEPAILLLDDPTKGIDLGTKADLYAFMDDLCAQGVSILLHSSDDKELLAVSDRVLVFNAGRCVAELAGAERNELALYRAAYLTERGEAEHA
ncbi:MAG: sugar ABC transporter ATP-binding protein [Roseiarcus sp.]